MKKDNIIKILRYLARLDNSLAAKQDHITGEMKSHINKVAIDKNLLN